MEVIATIDAARPTGRRIIRDLKRHSRVVTLNYPQPKNISGYTLEESYNMGLDRLSKHYGVDFRTL